MRSGVVSGITHYTVRLVWHEGLRSHANRALLVLGVLLFALGAVVLARPFVRRTSTLVVAVPVAAVAGLLALGVLAVVVAAMIAAAQGDTAAGDALSNLIPGNWPRRRRRTSGPPRRSRAPILGSGGAWVHEASVAMARAAS